MSLQADTHTVVILVERTVLCSCKGLQPHGYVTEPLEHSHLPWLLLQTQGHESEPEQGYIATTGGHLE